MPKLEVQHWLRTAYIRQIGTRHIFNLHEVSGDYEIPGELEFPRIVSRWDMFLRVVSSGPVRAEMRVRIHRQRRSGQWILMNDYRSASAPLTASERGFAFYDRAVPLAQVRLEGPGFYSISLYFGYDDSADHPFDRAEEMPWDPEEPEWEFAAVEYVRVVR